MTRLVTGVVALGLFIFTLIVVDPAPEALTTRELVTAEVTAADVPFACPGWVLLPVGDVGGSPGVGIDPGSAVVAREVFTSGGDTPVVAEGGFVSPSDVGLSFEEVERGDLAGLAAASCAEPRVDTWLLGGSTTLGHSARLVLINPTKIPADVVATLYGPNGEVEQPIVVAVGSMGSKSILIEGVAAELATLAVHVESDGAGVVAMLQDSRLTGFVAAGTEWVVPVTMSTHAEIVGVGPSDPGGDDGAATVRVMAPAGATVSLSLVDDTGPQPWFGVNALRIEPGEVVDVDVPASALSTVVIDSDTPIIAAAIAAVGREPEEGLAGDIARDIVWVNGQNPAPNVALSAIVPPRTVTLVTYAAHATTLRVTNVGTGAVVIQSQLSGGTTVAFSLSLPEGTVLTVDGGVAWVLRVEDSPAFVTAVQPIDTHHYPVTISVVQGAYVPLG